MSGSEIEKKDCYQTLEKWDNRACSPGYCTEDDAWLGDAYYYWVDDDDAIRWGQMNTRYKSRKYEIYKSEIIFDNILDTVFNKDHYYTWLKVLEKAAKTLTIRTGHKPTIKEINDFLKEKAKWDSKVNGILFQDIPGNKDYILVRDFFYRKRIQLAVYNKKIIQNFLFYSEGECYDRFTRFRKDG